MIEASMYIDVHIARTKEARIRKKNPDKTWKTKLWRFNAPSSIAMRWTAAV